MPRKNKSGHAPTYTPKPNEPTNKFHLKTIKNTIGKKSTRQGKK